MALGFTSTDLANLKAALASGALEVQIGDRRVKYRTQAELIAVIQMAQAEIDGVSEVISETPNSIRPTYSRG